MKFARFGILSALALLLASCNGSTSGGGLSFSPNQGLTVTSTADPAGDTFGGAPGATKWDILLVQTSRPSVAATNLLVTITTNNQPIFLPPCNPPAGPCSGTITQFGAELAFNTGASGATLAQCGAPLFTTYPNISFIVEPFPRQNDGGYRIMTYPGNTPTGFEATVNVDKTGVAGGNSIVYTVPLAALGGGSGAMQMGVVVGYFGTGSPTDCAPNTGTIST